MMTYSIGVMLVEEGRNQHAAENDRAERVRAALPAPVAKTSGVTPKMNAIEVIRIGRNRVWAARSAASRRSRLRAALVGELDDQNRALARKADQHDVADLREHVRGEVRRPSRDRNMTEL